MPFEFPSVLMPLLMSQLSGIPLPLQSGAPRRIAQVSPTSSRSQSDWAGLKTVTQLSQTSPTPSRSRSAWLGLARPGQLSWQLATPSPSESVSATPQPQAPGAILLGSLGQPSLQSAVPSRSLSCSAQVSVKLPLGSALIELATRIR